MFKEIFKKAVLLVSCLACVFIILWYQCMPEFGSAFFKKEAFFTDEALSWYQYTFMLGIVMAVFKIKKREFFLLLIILGFIPCCFSGLFLLGFLASASLGNLFAVVYMLTFAIVPAFPVVCRYILGNYPENPLLKSEE